MLIITFDIMIELVTAAILTMLQTFQEVAPSTQLADSGVTPPAHSTCTTCTSPCMGACSRPETFPFALELGAELPGAG